MKIVTSEGVAITAADIVRPCDFKEYRPMSNWQQDDDTGICVAIRRGVDIVYRCKSIELNICAGLQYYSKTFNGRWQTKKWKEVVEKLENMEWQKVG